MVILGGVGTVIGPAFGAAIFLMLKHVVSSHTDYWMLAVGAIFILCVIFLPLGFWGVVRKVRARLARWHPQLRRFPLHVHEPRVLQRNRAGRSQVLHDVAVVARLGVGLRAVQLDRVVPYNLAPVPALLLGKFFP